MGFFCKNPTCNKNLAMKKRMLRIAKQMQRFHQNETGLETLQVILILALGAIIAVAIYQFGGQAVDFLWECFYGSVSKTETPPKT